MTIQPWWMDVLRTRVRWFVVKIPRGNTNGVGEDEMTVMTNGKKQKARPQGVLMMMAQRDKLKGSLMLRDLMVCIEKTAMRQRETMVGCIENTARRHRRGGRSEVTVTSEPHTQRD